MLDRTEHATDVSRKRRRSARLRQELEIRVRVGRDAVRIAARAHEHAPSSERGLLECERRAGRDSRIRHQRKNSTGLVVLVESRNADRARQPTTVIMMEKHICRERLQQQIE